MAGNANLAEEGVNNSLWNVIADLQRQLRELKTTVQPIDARTLQTSRFPATGPILLGPYTLAAKSTLSVVLDIVLPSDIATLVNFEFSLFVNGYDNTTYYLWPTGAGAKVLSAAINIIASGYIDYRYQSPNPNQKRAICSAYSGDSVSHPIYFEVSFVVPAAASASTSGSSS